MITEEQLKKLRERASYVDFHCKTDIGDHALCASPDRTNVVPRAPAHMFRLLLTSPRWCKHACTTCKTLFEVMEKP